MSTTTAPAIATAAVGDIAIFNVPRSSSLMFRALTRYDEWHVGTVTKVDKKTGHVKYVKDEHGVVQQPIGSRYIVRASQFAVPIADVLASIGQETFASIVEVQDALRPFIVKGGR